MYLYLWRYRVRPECQAEFIDTYGPAGGWVRLFRSDPAYLGTRLLRDTNEPDCFLTIDCWESECLCAAFRERNRAAFDALDLASARLTSEETYMGAITST